MRSSRLAGEKGASPLGYLFSRAEDLINCLWCGVYYFHTHFSLGDEFFNSLYEEVSVQEAASQSCGLPLFSSSDAQSIGSGDRSFFLVQWVLVFVQGQTDLKLQPALCFSMHHQLLTAFFFFFRSCKTTNYDWHPWIRCFRQSRVSSADPFCYF
jgi:hypothetical protein